MFDGLAHCIDGTMLFSYISVSTNRQIGIPSRGHPRVVELVCCIQESREIVRRPNVRLSASPDHGHRTGPRPPPCPPRRPLVSFSCSCERVSDLAPVRRDGICSAVWFPFVRIPYSQSCVLNCVSMAHVHHLLTHSFITISHYSLAIPSAS